MNCPASMCVLSATSYSCCVPAVDDTTTLKMAVGGLSWTVLMMIALTDDSLGPRLSYFMN